jgi:hypothetical protein
VSYADIAVADDGDMPWPMQQQPWFATSCQPLDASSCPLVASPSVFKKACIPPVAICCSLISDRIWRGLGPQNTFMCIGMHRGPL